MSRDRSWMYQRFLSKGKYNPEFLLGVDRFVEQAFKHPPSVMRRDGKDMIRCPCKLCDNTKFLTADEVSKHLCMEGFTLYYTCWRKHGETETNEGSNGMGANEGVEEMNGITEMVLDAAGPNYNWDTTNSDPNPNAEEFYKMLEAADKPLWELGASETNLKCKESLLSVVSQLLNLKSDFQIPRDCFDRMTSIIKSILPEKDILPPNFYEAKKILRGLGLKYRKIDVCPNEEEIIAEEVSSEPSSESDGSSSESSADEREVEQPVAKKRKFRGQQRLGANVPRRKRPKLFVLGDMAFRSKPYDKKVVNTITQIVFSNVGGPYMSYSEFTVDEKMECLRAFLLKYRWGNKDDSVNCSKVFHRIASSRYSNTLTKIRRQLAKKAKSNDPNNWKQFTPDWCHPHHWKQLCDKWKSPTWQVKSTQNRQNQIKGGIATYHRHGSANAYSHVMNMEEKLKRPVTFIDAFIETHVKKDNKNEFLTAKAHTILETYKRMMTEAYGTDDSTKWPDFDEEVWFQASGGKAHGRLYGIPAALNSDSLPGGSKSKYRVLHNLSDELALPSSLSSRKRGAHMFYDDIDDSTDDDDDEEEDDDDEDDDDYVPSVITDIVPNFKKNRFDAPEYDESLFDFEVSSSDEEVCTSGANIS